MKKIIIFDLDGTLLYTLEDLKDSVNYVLNKFSYPLCSLEQVRQFVGNGVSKLIQRAIPMGINNPHFEKCLEQFKTHYSKNMYNKTSPYPQIIKLLNHLKEQDYIVTVVSNKFDTAVKELCNKYFPNLIDIAIGENEAQGISKKPSPTSINAILKNYNLTPQEAIYIGDSEVDIQTAQNANMDCISVTWGYKDLDFLKNSGAKIFVNSPKEIIDILETKYK